MVYRTRRDRSRPPPVSLVSIMAIVGITACSSASGPSGSGSGGGSGRIRPGVSGVFDRAVAVRGGGALELVEGASGLASPVYLTAPLGGSQAVRGRTTGARPDRQQWRARTDSLSRHRGPSWQRGRTGPARAGVSCGPEPNYAANGFFYVSFTDLAGNTRVERFAVSPDPSAADVSSAKLILGVGQPFSNHIGCGGLVAFGPDGMLYIGLGDGGSGGDPLAHGQNTGTLLGSLLRIDVVAARRPTPDSAADRC